MRMAMAWLKTGVTWKQSFLAGGTGAAEEVAAPLALDERVLEVKVVEAMVPVVVELAEVVVTIFVAVETPEAADDPETVATPLLVPVAPEDTPVNWPAFVVEGIGTS